MEIIQTTTLINKDKLYWQEIIQTTTLINKYKLS